MKIKFQLKSPKVRSIPQSFRIFSSKTDSVFRKNNISPNPKKKSIFCSKLKENSFSRICTERVNFSHLMAGRSHLLPRYLHNAPDKFGVFVFVTLQSHSRVFSI